MDKKPETLFWGDIHNHNEVGVGKGSLERSYSIARSNLDFYAFTPHGWWPDITSNDPKVKEYHLKGFALVKQNWDKLVARANEMNSSGKFVSFIAYEWHSSQWGDYCIYFSEDKGSLYYAEDINKLKSFVKENNALMLPHHCAYRKGWRGTNWATYSSSLSPTAEIFSEHGNSLEPQSHWSMYRHSMGGSDRSQTVLRQLMCGKHIGITAGTDDHFGYPGSYGEGLTGIYAGELTRKDIMSAIRKRHTYAVTGDRIELSVNLNEAMMGDIINTDTVRELHVEGRAMDEIDYIELIKNGKSLTKWNLQTSLHDECYRDLIKLEWGWDGMGSKEISRWDISIKVEYGEIIQSTPCFCGGPDITEKENSIEHQDSHNLVINSYTCRSNFNPTQAVILDIEGGPDALLNIYFKGKWGSNEFSRSISIKKRNLKNSDAYFDILSIFTAPKLKIHKKLPYESLYFNKKWKDIDRGGEGNEDFYIVKVLQRNGQMAWSSPIWCTG